MVDWLLAANFIGGAIISITIISNPISTSAIFIALTGDMDHPERMETIRRSIRYSVGILVFFAFTGLALFELFGITIGAFRIAGGVLLFTTAVSMLNPKTREEEAQEKGEDIALIPLSIPFTAGPGTIVTVVVLMSEAMNYRHGEDLSTVILAGIGVFLGIAVCIVVSYYMMKESERIDKKLGSGRRVLTRLMGLIVMAIAVQFILNGTIDVLPQFIDAAEGASGLMGVPPWG